MKVLINGIGVVGSFGHGIASLAEAAAGQGLISLGQPTGACLPAETARMADATVLSRFVAAKSLRRIDHYSRMAILAGYLALADAKEAGGMAEEGLSAPMGLIVATGMGPTAGTLEVQSPDAKSADLRLSPIQFSNSVHNAAAAHISMLLKIRGPNLSINHYDMSVPLAFQTAMDWLEEGRAASVLVGGVDCFSKGLHDAFRDSRSGGDGNNGALCPVPVGEGGAFFVLTLSEATETRYPFIRDVQVGRNPGDLAVPSDALVIDNGSGDEAELIGSCARRAVFSHIYGAFPSSMALDVAVASLLFAERQYFSAPGSPPQIFSPAEAADSGPDFQNNPRVCCLKKGVAGDFGMIELGKR